ncbi:MAG: FtsX-like permease family protein [Clostridium sp.]|uniref:ABC transporter permease n=1 Tax=Clostridium sp. TaxID=1506 RepID=UPI002FC6AE50
MYILKNAIRNIIRSKGRNILIGLIALVIAASSYIALSIKDSATKAEEGGREDLSITASINLDRNKVMESAKESGEDPRIAMKSHSSLSLEELQKYAKSKSITDFYFNVNTTMNGFEIDPVDESDTDDSSSSMFNPKNTGGLNKRGNEGEFTVSGFSSNNAMTSFLSGSSKILSGKMFSESENNLECIISNELASLNGLSVGDKIVVSNPNLDDETYNLTISGIYENTESTSNNMRFSTSSDPANQIYISYASLNQILNLSSENAIVSTDIESGEESTTELRNEVSGTYVFKDVNGLESFKSEVIAMGLNENYSVESIDVNSYEQSLIPLKNLSKFAGVFLIVVLAIGCVILVVLNIFNIRERKYEVGVLTAIGMKKKNVLLQYLSEVFIVMFTAIVIGTGIGLTAAPKITSNLLSAQVQSQQEQKQDIENNFGRGGNKMPPNSIENKVEYIEEINTSADIGVIIKILQIGVGLILISGSAAIVFILRYEPLKILSNRA